ncbi:MAG: YCF48-related protein, partial [Nitrososphaerales archaeon]
MKSLLHILIFILLLTQQHFPQWTNQNPVPDKNDLNSVFFINDSTGWIVGTAGFITKTTNAGVDWLQKNSGTTTDLNAIYFIDSDTGWAVGRSGLIIKTTNGGLDWIQQSSGTSVKLKAVHFYSTNIGWVVGYDGTILKTSNGGINWNIVTSGTTYPLFSVYFIDALTGWAVGGQTAFQYQLVVVLKTTDGGNNWFEQPLNLGNITGPLYSVYFIDFNIGWVVGAGSFITKTTNGGETWTRQYFTNLIDEPETILQEDYVPGEDGIGGNLSVFFKDENTGWIAGGGDYYNVKKARIVQTSDGGSTWYVNYYSPVTTWLASVFVTSGGKGWAVGYNGNIFISNENGLSWDGQLSGNYARINSISFINENTGWATGNRFDFDRMRKLPIIMKTTNSGKIWENKFSTPSENLNTPDLSSFIFFLDEFNGWAVLNAVDEGTGIIYKTTDGGENWTFSVTTSGNIIRSIFFTDQNIGWVTGSVGVFKSTDGGITWIEKNLVGGASIYFIDANNGWICGGDGILKSTDSGDTWIVKSSLTASYVRFYNTSIGMCVGESGTILLSIDGGETWNTKNGPNLQSINFTNSTTVWGYTSDGTIYKSENSGDSWDTLNTGLGMDGAAFFVNDYTGWIGIDTDIFKYYKQPTAPLSPTNLSASADTFSVMLEWVDNSSNEIGFVIERKDGDSLSVNPYLSVDTVLTGMTSSTDTGLTYNTTYTYRVFGYNNIGNS